MSSATWCTTSSAGGSGWPDSPASRPSGTSSRRRRRCSRNGRGTPTILQTVWHRCRRRRPIPAELVERMRAAKEFGKGYQARTQMFYAAVSYRLHLDRPDDLTADVRRAAGALRPVPLPARHAFPRPVRPPRGLHLGLLHLHVEPRDRQGHVLGLRSRATCSIAQVAHRYRDEILARGGSARRRRSGGRVPRPAVLVRRLRCVAGPGPGRDGRSTHGCSVAHP